ncbi:AT-rich interactive domain-containing protein [Arachis hypogaea]|nr:AT-rich interactive domain-containing protein [Arachis hypogaea]
MMCSGEPLDLYKLFMVVKEKGGYDAVCKNMLWDLVAEEYGLGLNVGSSIELVYSKHLSTLETWLKNVADSKFPECGLMDDRVSFGKKLMEVQADFLLDVYSEEGAGDKIKTTCDFVDGRKLCGTNRVRGLNPELSGAKKIVDLNALDHKMNGPSIGSFCSNNFSNNSSDIQNHLNEIKTSTVDISDEANIMPTLSEEGDSCDKNDGHDDDDDVMVLDPSDSCDKNDGHDDDDDDVMVLDPSTVNKESFGRKRKRESMSEMLSWLTGIAKNPCDPAVGSMPEKSKWKSYGSEEIWKQVLLFRQATFFSSDHVSWQKMHPCMYDDQVGANYNLRERLKSDKNLTCGVSSNMRGIQGGSERNPSPHSEVEKLLLDQCSMVPIPVGPSHQAEVPEWTGVAIESDSKWLGSQIWPSAEIKSKVIERDPIGTGRKDSCGCEVQGSVECVRFHIAQKRAKVKLELGVAFYLWNLHKTGEDVRRLWTEDDEKKFKDVVKSNPPSLEKCFWDQIFKSFPTKSREDLVSYYFNVFILQRRGYQNRNTPDDIDSDDDESEYGPLKNAFGHQTHKSRNITLLSPKKPKKTEHSK